MTSDQDVKIQVLGIVAEHLKPYMGASATPKQVLDWAIELYDWVMKPQYPTPGQDGSKPSKIASLSDFS
jgi:hypothetical protein